jgi:hypothetical protein
MDTLARERTGNARRKFPAAEPFQRSSVAVSAMRAAFRQPESVTRVRNGTTPERPFVRAAEQRSGDVPQASSAGLELRARHGSAGEDPNRLLRPDVVHGGDSFAIRHSGHFVFARRIPHARFARIDTMSPRNHVHHFRITSPDDLDEVFAGWVREAYEVGEQRHLLRSRRRPDRSRDRRSGKGGAPS